LEREGKVRKTHGGVVLLGVIEREDSFTHRLGETTDAKERLAGAVVPLLGPDDTVFVGSSTSAYHAARRVLAKGTQVTLPTNPIPAMGLFSMNEARVARPVGLGGVLRQITMSLVRPHATRAVHAHYAGKALISGRGIADEGYLTGPYPLEAEVKRAMAERPSESIWWMSGSLSSAACK